MKNFDSDFIQYSKEKVKNEKERLGLYLFTHIVLYILLIFFAIFFIWYTAFITTHKFYMVIGASMKDSLNSSLSLTDATGEEDGVFVNCVAKVKLYDIVVVKKTGQKKNVVKRLTGFEGDYVSISAYVDENSNKTLYFYRIASGTDLTDFDDESARVDESSGVNGYKIYSYSNWTEEHGTITKGDITYEEDFFLTFLQDFQAESEDYFVSDSGRIYVKVPKGMFFCLGDNRAYSVDSRLNGFYDMSQIVGRVEIIVYNHTFANRLWVVVKYYFAAVEKFFAR